MKNLVWAIGALIVIILAVFIFSSKQKNNDTVIPSPLNVASSTPDLLNLNLNQSTGEAKKMQLAFPLLEKNQIEGKKVKITTNKGDIIFELFADAPIASSNFIYLANKKFYDGLVFHRVIKGFMIQGGDPNGTGTGGPGYNFEDELNPETTSYKSGYIRGVVAMANSGPNTNGSQFFIMHQDYQLPHSYSIFGHVISGLDVVDIVANTEVDGRDKPIQPIIMKSVIIE